MSRLFCNAPRPAAHLDLICASEVGGRIVAYPRRLVDGQPRGARAVYGVQYVKDARRRLDCYIQHTCLPGRENQELVPPSAHGCQWKECWESGIEPRSSPPGQIASSTVIDDIGRRSTCHRLRTGSWQTAQTGRDRPNRRWEGGCHSRLN